MHRNRSSARAIDTDALGCVKLSLTQSIDYAVSLIRGCVELQVIRSVIKLSAYSEPNAYVLAWIFLCE